jgi:hypothetical protein
MELHFKPNDQKRKTMVEAIAKELGIQEKYLGMPSAAYQIGGYAVNKDGSLSFDDSTDIAESSRVIDACVMAGFEPEEWEHNSEEEQPERLTISMPSDKVSVDNLKKLLVAKGNLIRKALGIEDTSITVSEDTVSFPWFDSLLTPEELEAYTRFIAALCEMSVKAKRVTAKEKAVDNDKYAFRCFLLRLGMIGDEYKKDRKILLRNLTGSAAFKSGVRKDGEQQ